MRRLAGVLLGGSFFVAALAAPALAAAEEGHGAGPTNFVGMAVVAVIGIAVPLLFLAVSRASQARDPEDDELEPVVAGIGQGGAPVPRWLYAVYVIIPLWAGLYFVANQQVPGELASATPEATHAPEPTTAPPTEDPGPKTEVTIVAKDIEFDIDTIRFPANTQVEVTLDNRDAGTQHNFAVYADDTLSDEYFNGSLFAGVAKRTYEFETPAAGTYFYVCTIHPNMSGDLIVV